MDEELDFVTPSGKRTTIGYLVQWRPIETAPKGVGILLARVGGMSCSGYWGGKNWYSYANDDMILQPTHWAPMPPAPSQS